jgi:hypothetical protein
MNTPLVQAPSCNPDVETRLSKECLMRYGVSQEVFRAAIAAAKNAPDPRLEQADLASALLEAGKADAHQLAEALIRSIVAETDR